MHPKRIMTRPNGSMRQTSHGPRPQEANPPGGEAKTHSHRVYLGFEEVEGPRGLGGGVQNGFLEEVSMGISEQFTSFFEINIAFICFLTS